MRKLKVNYNKILKLNNVLKFKILFNKENFELEMAIQQMESYIRTKGASQIGPLIQFTKAAIKEGVDVNVEIIMMMQCSKYIHNVEYPYSMESTVRVNNTLSCRYEGQEDKLSFAYQKIQKEKYMSLKCLASNYVVTERDGIYYVYNKIYEENEKMILALAILGLFIPEASDYFIPICIEIRKMNNDVVITKKLDVKGSDNYRYFIASHQYEKWKKVNLIIKNIIYIISIAIDVLFGYLFIKTNFNLLMGICVVLLLFLTIGAIFKLEINNRKRQRFKIIDIVFEQ